MGIKNYSKRFHLLNHYSKRGAGKNIEEESNYLEKLFKGQGKEKQIKDVINVWRKCRIL
ncbi:MAG: hypothetical protein J7K12_06215 [Thermoplasmata archaeon]|nr:hypothetical protein [Thermoplasmata archaeon]